MQLKVAVVGSGPAGFYAAGALLASEDPPVEVDLIERLPTPWGLVRLGVAPDHPNIKAVSRAFEKIAARPGFRFFGNVEVGRDVSHEELRALYDAVVYAVGAQTDRRLGIPGEDLPGSWPATEFVAWYNGHPDFQELEFDLSGERAVVVGNGNVAVDVARMLALTQEELRRPTRPTRRSTAIVGSGIRGDPDARPARPGAGGVHDAGAAGARRARRRRRRRRSGRPRARPGERGGARGGRASARAANVDLLREYAARAPTGKPRRIVLRFLRLAGRDPRRRTGSRRSRSSATARRRRGRPHRRAADRRDARRSPAGSSSAASATTASPLPGVPFDERRGTIPNDGGRVRRRRRAGLYCAGWIKRGPSGVIGTNKKDATETAEQLLEDARAGAARGDGRDAATLEDAARASAASRSSTYAGWEAIDAAERRQGSRTAGRA